MTRLQVIRWRDWHDTRPHSFDVGSALELLFCWFRDRLKQHNDQFLEDSIMNMVLVDVEHPMVTSDEEYVDHSNYLYFCAQDITKAEAFVPLVRNDDDRLVPVSRPILRSLLDDCEKVLEQPDQASVVFPDTRQSDMSQPPITPTDIVDMCRFTHPRLTQLYKDPFFERAEFFITT